MVVKKEVKPVYSIVEGTEIGLPLVNYWLKKGSEVYVQTSSGIQQIKEITLEMEFENKKYNYFKQVKISENEEGKVWKYLLKEVASGN